MSLIERCNCIMAAHCSPTKAGCRLKAGGTVNAGGGVCSAGSSSTMAVIRRPRECTRCEGIDARDHVGHVGDDGLCPGCRLIVENEAMHQQLRGAVAENEKLRLQVAALENDGMELAARLGEAEEQIARLTATGGR